MAEQIRLKAELSRPSTVTPPIPRKPGRGEDSHLDGSPLMKREAVNVMNS